VSQEQRNLRDRLSDDRNAQNLFKGFLENVTIEEPVEKLILLRLIKNAQMQVELCEIPLAGAPEILRRRRT
jgi:hypothetical protein